MRLSKLHINGFKSFPDRAELGFDSGVTAIVGPNGCGKSNVVDAITWVLGEQSAKSLRGERMEDVIFNGSDARKPTATAEVRLKLTEVAQAAMAAATTSEPIELLDQLPLVTRDVEIGRRLYRSGESEYLIDGEVCRLRDVHDLLMDSGLGVKAYAVIEQGKIGQILSSRPAERRALIEEAAGVTKYKARRRSAELKLEAARQNLTRVDDIIFEVEKQRGALKRQAARARRYRRLREELRRWEQVQFARRHATLLRDIEQFDARLAEVRVRETAAAARVAELEVELETLRLGLTQAESGATASRDETHARELDYGRRQQQVEFDRQQIGSLEQQAESLAAEVGDLEARRDPARQATEAQRAAALRAGSALGEAAGRVSDCEADYRTAVEAVQSAEHDADALRAAVLAASGTLAALRQAQDHAASARDRVAAERERLDLEARELATEVDRLREASERSAGALAAAREALQGASVRKLEAEAEVLRLRAEREAVQQRIGVRERDLAATEARLASLEELEASRATFGEAARYLLNDTTSVRHLGAVADHLVVEHSYERAVDALLGPLLQHVVVSTSDDVAAALAALGGADAGRCGFLIVDQAATSALPEPAPSAPAGARTLSSVVRAKGDHAAAIERVIGGAFVVETLDEARALSRSVPVPVATLAGDVFHGSWRFEGGSRRDARGILETRADIAALRDRVRRGAAELEGDRERAAACAAAMAAGDTAVTEAIALQHDQEKAIVGLEADVRRVADDLMRAERRLDVVATDRQRAEEEERAAEARREESVAAIAQHDRAQRDAEARLVDVAARLQTARETAEAKTRRVTEARTEQATLVERLAGLETEAARLAEASRELEERIGQRRAEINRTEVRRQELRESILQTERLLDDDVRAIEGLRARVRELDEKVVVLRTEFSTADHAIRAARTALDAVRGELMQSELSRATASSDLAHLAETCQEVIGASIDEVVAAVERMEDAGELTAPARRLAAAAAVEDDEREEGEAVEEAAAPADETAGAPLGPEDVIADLKKKIERLGPVNMMAIEQFDELEGRHAFLTTQRQDLLDSISQTGEAIRRIDKTTGERFEEAFHSINAHFETTFTTLFGGGRAGLVLIDQENDPESGIDIIAQPPGKRLQNVQLLSGGEKALTAMALMFAVFKHRPSPFCLLDEIDAPLDDANIGRFVEMLQGMQGHTQFILITHNRKTMEIADRLYGVTMEEPGVSKLISVQLN